MPLLEIWNATRDSVLKMNVEAIVRIAGDGQLKDGSETSIEFRQFLTEVESEKLAEYATYCIETKTTKNTFLSSGQVLQDVINEMGRRLGFKAENGRYQGVKNDIGYDGIWSSNGEHLVIEVKTTDAYTIKLDVIAGYRDRLVEEQRVPKETPILLVIGRNDTESLEAQVRGSKHAWSMRIISIDALIKLMEVNLSTLSNEVTEKIHTILRPFEYTRIDKIVDVVFTTAEDKENEAQEPEDINVEVSAGEATSQIRTPKEVVMLKKRDCIRRVSEKYGRPIQQKKHSMYADASDSIRAVAAVSKRYEKSETFYWYAYHDEPQRKFLANAKTGLMVFGLTDQDKVFAVPFDLLERHWDGFYETRRRNGHVYKHIYIYLSDGKFYLRVREKGTEVDLTEYLL